MCSHTLILQNLAITDFGNCSCMAENSLGRDRGFIQLSGKEFRASGVTNFVSFSLGINTKSTFYIHPYPRSSPTNLDHQPAQLPQGRGVHPRLGSHQLTEDHRVQDPLQAPQGQGQGDTNYTIHSNSIIARIKAEKCNSMFIKLCLNIPYKILSYNLLTFHLRPCKTTVLNGQT